MILVDTSVWVDHLRGTDSQLRRLLEETQVLTHPFVVGELALGGLRSNDPVRLLMAGMRCADLATDAEVLRLVDTHQLASSGIGSIDAHLLAATALTHGAKLWSLDQRLQDVARRMGLGFEPASLAP